MAVIAGQGVSQYAARRVHAIFPQLEAFLQGRDEECVFPPEGCDGLPYGGFEAWEIDLLQRCCFGINDFYWSIQQEREGRRFFLRLSPRVRFPEGVKFPKKEEMVRQ